MFEGFLGTSSGSRAAQSTPQEAASKTTKSKLSRGGGKSSSRVADDYIDDESLDDTDLLKQLGAKGPMRYGSIYTDGTATFDSNNPLNDKRRRATKAASSTDGEGTKITLY